MDATITLKDAGLIIIGIGLIALIFYAVYLLKNMVTTVKSVNKILQDTEVISGIAAERSKDVDKVISDVTESVESVADIIRGNQSTVSALTSIINSIASLRNIFSKGDSRSSDD